MLVNNSSMQLVVMIARDSGGAGSGFSGIAAAVAGADAARLGPVALAAQRVSGVGAHPWCAPDSPPAMPHDTGFPAPLRSRSFCRRSVETLA